MEITEGMHAADRSFQVPNKGRRAQPSAAIKATTALQRAGMAEHVWTENEVQKLVVDEKAGRLNAKGPPRDREGAHGANFVEQTGKGLEHG